MYFESIETLKPVSSGAAISIQDDIIASSLEDNIVLTNINTGEVLKTYEGDGETISSICISADKQFLVFASRSLQLHVVNLETDNVSVIAKAHESAILSLTIDPTSTLIASGGAEGAVKVWDLRSLRLTHNLKGHGALVTALGFYGKLGTKEWKLASGSDEGKIIIWDLVKSRVDVQLNNHSSTITSLKWTSTGAGLISGSRDKVLSVFNHNELAATVPILEEINTVGTSSSHIYVGCSQSIKTLSLSAELVDEWRLDSNESEIAMLLSANDLVYAFLSDQTVLVFEINSHINHLKTLSVNQNEIIDLLYVDRKVVLATNSCEVRMVNLDSNLLEFVSFVGHEDIVISIDLLSNWLLTGAKDKVAKLWDLHTRECKLSFRGHTGSIGAVALSRGQSKVPQFCLTGSQDLTIKKWNADGEAEYTRKAHDKDINTMDVSQNNKLFATGSQDRTIKIWSVETGEVLGILRGHRRGVWSVKFGKGNTLISGSGDKTVKVWDLNNFQCIKTFEGHTNSVLKVVQLNDQHIASAGGDGLVKVWDIKSSECVATLDGHEEKVWALTKTENDNLVSGAGDGVLHVWEDRTEEMQVKMDKEEEEQLEMQQDLENSVRNEEWDRAIKLALKLNRPLKLLKLFTDVAEFHEEQSISGLVAVDQVLHNLEGKPLLTLMERIRDWNANGKTSLVAQNILHTLIRGPQSREKLSSSAMLKIVTGIIPYTKRHLDRTADTLEQSYALDYTLREMAI